MSESTQDKSVEYSVEVNGLSFPRKIATLDCETLALSEDAAVTEVGIIIADLHCRLDRQVVVENQTPHYAQFNVLDQIARGSAFDSKTWVFHMKHSGMQGLHEQIAGGLLIDPSGSVNNLRRIQDLLDPVEEIWINGTSFDPIILGSLVQKYQFETKHSMNRLWLYSKERDVRTIYRTVPNLCTSDKRPDHRALFDAGWNLEVAAAYYTFLAKASV